MGCSLIVALCADFSLLRVNSAEYFLKLRDLLRVNPVRLFDELSTDASVMAT